MTKTFQDCTLVCMDEAITPSSTAQDRIQKRQKGNAPCLTPAKITFNVLGFK